MNCFSDHLSAQQNDSVNAFTQLKQLHYVQLKLVSDLSLESIIERCGRLAIQHEILSTRLVSKPAKEGAYCDLDILKTATLYARQLPVDDACVVSDRTDEIEVTIERDLSQHYFDYSLYAHRAEGVLYLTMPAWSGDIVSLNVLTQTLMHDPIRLESDEDSIQYVDLLPIFADDLESDEGQTRRLKWSDVFSTSRSIQPISDGSANYRPTACLPVPIDLQQEDDQFLALLTAWTMVLGQHYRGQQLLLAFYFDGRSIDELADVVGPLAKLLPLHIDLEKVISAIDLKSQIQQQVSLASDGAEYFDWRFDGSNGQAYCDAGFEVLPGVGAVNGDVVSSAAEQVGVLASHQRLGHQPISLQVNSATKGNNQLRVIFDLDFFCAAEVTVLTEQLATVYQQIIEKPNVAASRLSFLSELHTSTLLSWSRGDTVARNFSTFSTAFEHFSKHSPAAIALDFGSARGFSSIELLGDRQVTYAELNERANQLAHFLVEEGVVCGNPVGLCLEKGLEQVISLIALIKLGCCVVPMDPAYPQAHLNRIIESTECQLILSNTEHLHKVSESSVELTLIDWQADRHDIVECSTSNLCYSPSESCPAYMVHTSGSTGVPKGVVVSQAALQNYVEGIDIRLNLPTQASMMTLSSVAADLGYTAIFGALGTGRCLRIVGEACSIDPEMLALELRDHPVDCLKLVPSHLAALLTSIYATHILPKQCLVLGGEAADVGLLRRVQSLSPSLRIVNHYGPTEATVGISCGDIDAQSPINVGAPIANTGCYVLNKDLQLVGIGIEGDLYLTGDGLSDGYHRSPAATASAFVPTPSSLATTQGQRMYYSGDRAYYNKFGKLVFAGRKDQQVKIRGHRIELDEISVCIRRQFPDQLLAVDVKEVNDEPRLIVYLVAPVVSVDDIQTFLEAQLPSQMQPHYWLEIPALPLKSNGKLDKQMLPLPVLNSAGNNRAGIDKRDLSIAESTLLSILRPLLGRDDIGLNDNFFTLGGDSIVAIQLVARAKQEGFKISAKQVLDFPTIYGLAEVATAVEFAEASEGTEIENDVPFELAAIQRRFFGKILIQPNQYNQSTILELDASVELEAIRQCVAELLRSHDMLRSRMLKNGDKGWQQVIEPYTEDLLEKSFVCRSLHNASESEGLSYMQQLETAIALEQSTFELENGPLIRFVWFDGEGDLDEPLSSRLFVTAHHLLVDAVSWSILEFDLKTLYRQLKAKQPLQLPEKTQSYPHWIKKTQGLLGKDYWREDSNYWSGVMENSVALPVDASLVKQHNKVANASNCTKLLPSTLLENIERYANVAFNTRTEELLLTALCYGFRSWTEQSSLSITMEANGRDVSSLEHDSSRTVGWFTSMYPVNLKIDSQASALENLKRVKEQLRSVPESGFSYGVLTYLADTQCDAGDIALDSRNEPQISFNFFGRLFSQEDGDSDIRKSNLFNLAQTETRALSQDRVFIIDVMAMHTEQGLGINFIYSPDLISGECVQSILDNFERALVDLVTDCVESEGGMTPSDFNDVSLSQAEIDHLFETNTFTKGQVENIYPATQVQAGILFHSLTMPDTGVYVPQHAIEINLPLQVQEFKAAWQRVIDRHAPFRTLFVNLDNAVPLQVVLRDVEVDFLELDWSQASSEIGDTKPDRRDIEDNFEKLLKEQWLAPFNLATAPLMRLCLVKLSSDCYRLIWTYHHALIDGWSGPIVLRELFTIYEQLCSGDEIELPTNPSFVDYIRWLQKQDEDEALEFWSKQVEDFHFGKQLSEVLRPPSVAPELPGKYEVAHQLSSRDTSALINFARQQGVTLSVVCQAAWALLLYRYTQEKDMMFGVTVSGRPADLGGVESIVGQLINTLPFRVRVNLNQPLNAFLKSLHQLYVQSDERAFIPLAKIQSRLTSRLSSGPFDSLLVFENYPIGIQESAEQGEEKCRHLYSVSQNNYPLSLVIVPGEKLQLTLKYSPKYFGVAQLENVSIAYQHILNQLSQCVNEELSRLNLGDISLFESDELARIRGYYSGELIEPDAHSNMADRFSKLAQKYPDRAALIAFDADRSTLTYQRLDLLAKQFCNFLIEEGLKENDCIGILLSRSKEYVISVLGCLKAGCRFVPLDPESSSERLGIIVESISLDAVVTNTEYFEKVSNHSLDLIIDWDQDRELISSSPTHCPDITIHPDQCAYTICTSGTTGKPKGVNISHRALLSYIDAIELRLGLPDQASLGALATPAADLSYTALFGALGTGRAFRLISEAKKLDSDALASEFATLPVSCLKIVPSHLSALLTVGDPQRILPSDCLVLGGEAPSEELLGRVKKLAPHLRVINHYGPTETTIGIACHEFDLDPQNRRQSTARCIGRPLANSQCYVLDERLTGVGFGVEADLYVGGPQLALGYESQAALTAQTFIPDPFSADLGARMYRTGDRAHFLFTGELIFNGRKDQQKKIRGYRVELGEIEACLLRHEDIQQAAVAFDEVNQREQLIAYLVGKAQIESKLKDYLQVMLPEHMLPKQFVWLTKFPLTSNGKLNRKLLPKPSRDQRDISLPSSNLQREIARIWSEFLVVESISTDDNFFDLGGDSLMLMRVHRRICDEIAESVQITDLFKFSTISQLADYIAAECKGVETNDLDMVSQNVQIDTPASDVSGVQRSKRSAGRKKSLAGRQARARAGRRGKPQITDSN
jgi:amino acid adenylation domain-containing protein/non-ribosomal peptide synthase protein (TIGR01720 family)